jgi:heme o synthase
VASGTRQVSSHAREPIVLARTATVPIARSGANLRTYLSFVKPHIDVTFVVVALTGSVLAGAHSGSVPIGTLLGVAGAVALLAAGAESWTNLLDRDIDAVMHRTAGRPLPSGEISVRSAVVLATLLTVAGLTLAATLGKFPLLFLTLGLLDNVVIYSALSKRTTPWSIVLGAPVGSLTLWAGYAAVDKSVSGSAWLLGAMVAAWVPVHIWAIATRYRDDYRRASVPMAPVVWGRRGLACGMLVSSLTMGMFAVAGLVAIGKPEAPWVVAPVAIVSLLLAAGAVVMPWRERLAVPLIRVATAYLVLVLFAAIGLAA